MVAADDILRTWEDDGFKLETYDTHRRDNWGKAVLGYRFWDRGELIFQGEDYHCSPMHCIDSDEATVGLLAFLRVGEGDTDEEYFASYTPRQLEWRDSDRREALDLIVFDWEERIEGERKSQS